MVYLVRVKCFVKEGVFCKRRLLMGLIVSIPVSD